MAAILQFPKLIMHVCERVLRAHVMHVMHVTFNLIRGFRAIVVR